MWMRYAVEDWITKQISQQFGANIGNTLGHKTEGSGRGPNEVW